MPANPVELEIIDRIHDLDHSRLLQVLNFLRQISTKPQGTPGISLLRFSGCIDPGELNSITEVIESGCEQVDLNDW